MYINILYEKRHKFWSILCCHFFSVVSFLLSQKKKKLSFIF